MPKVNVYLPEDLAAAVRQAGIPVSPVCQRALAEAVRQVGRGRRAVGRLRDPDFDPGAVPQVGARIRNLMTPRLSEAVRLARAAAGAGGEVATTHLLIGLLDEGDNLGVRVLQAHDVDVEEIRNAAVQIDAENGQPAAAPSPAQTDQGGDEVLWSRLSQSARLSIASTLEAAIDLGHNYLGCEHLLLGLLDSEDSGAARVLRSFGLDAAGARRAVASAIAGFAHARQTAAPVAATQLDEIVRRLEAVERRLGSVAPP
jgi:ATP-dependent Clp protease ATP-binding subunit ClpA